MNKENNPWIIHESELKYENPWISVTEHKVMNPSGNPGIYGVVHFKNLAIGVVPYQDGKIWLVGQYRFPLEEYSWEIPEGGGLIGESPLENAKRELREETGLTAAEYSVLLEMDISNSVTDESGIVYLARELNRGEASPDDTEDLKLRELKLEDAYAEVEAGKIRDSLTVAAICKLMLMKCRGELE